MCQRLEESQNLASKVTRPIVMKLHHGDKPMTPEGDRSVLAYDPRSAHHTVAVILAGLMDNAMLQCALLSTSSLAVSAPCCSRAIVRTLRLGLAHMCR